MTQNKARNTILLVITLFLMSASSSLASSNGIDVNLQVGACNNNGICEPGSEDLYSCPADCTPKTVTQQTTSGSKVEVPVMDSVFNNLTIEVKNNSAVIKWKSSIPTMSNIKWGTNPDYKDGVVKNINFLMDHKVELTNLKSGTMYYFTIDAENLLGKTSTLENQVFQTLSSLDTVPPGNPTNVGASSDPNGVTVLWTNPSDSDFDYIRVMKNTDRYYASPYVGYLAYEGKGNYFVDSNVVDGVRYFYSLFSRDFTGNYSSGSMIDIIHNPRGVDNWGEALPGAETTRPLTEIFKVIQASSIYDFYGGNVFNLSGDSPITIKTNYTSKIKDDDIWIEIRNSAGVLSGKYFFSRVKDNDGYVSVIIPVFEKSGYYHIIVYRYEGGGAQIVNYGGLQITKASLVKQINLLFFWIILLLILLLIIYIIYRIFRRFIRKN